MEFSVNSPIIFVMVAIIILAVLGQSVYFLLRAWRRRKISQCLSGGSFRCQRRCGLLPDAGNV